MANDFVTVATRYRAGRIVRRYILKHDAKGYYFDGADCASFRRKTRAAIEAWMEQRGFDVSDVQRPDAAPKAR